ncbi:hypothetical protein LBSP_22120 [Lentilactobacillus buchneri subsp. silagei]|nr:hypothetical protein LBSP_22120 [Lentilactobacillus buchneri subsp. silagei]
MYVFNPSLLVSIVRLTVRITPIVEKKVTSIIDNVKDIHLPTIKDKYVAIIVIPMSIHLFLFLFIKAFALITSTSSESKSFNVIP